MEKPTTSGYAITKTLKIKSLQKTVWLFSYQQMPPQEQPRRQLRRGRPARVTEDSGKVASPIDAPTVNSNQQDISMEVEQSVEAPQQPDPRKTEATSSQPIDINQATVALTLGASSLPRKPVERLASLHSPYLSSTNERTLQAVPPTSRPASLRFQPKSYTRRSKEEREATDRAEAERRQASLGSTETSRGGFVARGRGRGNVLVHSTRDERLTGSGATGHLGARAAGPEPSKYRRGGRSGIGSGPRSREIQDDGAPTGAGVERNGTDLAVKAEKDRDGDLVMGATKSRATDSQVSEAGRKPGSRKTGRAQGGGRPAKIKEEPQIPESPWSDDEEVEKEEGRRIDIEEINLISDQEADAEGFPNEDAKGKERQVTPRQHQMSFKPIRLDRKEHKERAVGVNTDASSITSAELRRRAQEGRAAQGSLFLDDEELVVSTTKSKTRGKVRDVEFVRDERKWKGVYQDDDDSDAAPEVKEEPRDDDAMVVDEAPATAMVSPPTSLEAVSPEPIDDTEMLEAATPSAQPREDPAPESAQPKRLLPKRKIWRPLKPVLQTTEDHQEWDRGQRDKYKIGDTLSEIAGGLDLSPQAADNQEDVDMDAPREKKAFGELFLFQFPPALPMLVDPAKASIKAEPTTEQTHPVTSTQPEPVPIDIPHPSSSKPSTNKGPAAHKTKPPPSSSKAKSTPTKPAPNEKSTIEPLLPPAPQTYTPLSPAPPPGLFGALRLHASSRTTANWGSLRFEISRGAEENIAQEFVVCDWSSAVVKREEWETDGGGGRVRGEEVTVKEEERGEWKEEVRLGGEVFAMGEVGGGREGAAFVGVPCWGEMFGV